MHGMYLVGMKCRSVQTSSALRPHLTGGSAFDLPRYTWGGCGLKVALLANCPLLAAKSTCKQRVLVNNEGKLGLQIKGVLTQV